jgi:LAO/AO transport system kinase
VSGALGERRAARLAGELGRVVAARLAERVVRLSTGAAYERLQVEVAAGRLDPWSAADSLLAEALGEGPARS